MYIPFLLPVAHMLHAPTTALYSHLQQVTQECEQRMPSALTHTKEWGKGGRELHQFALSHLE